MDHFVKIINQVLPIIFLIALGYWIRRKQYLKAATINELRKIVVNLALPAVLFISFLNVEFKSSYFAFFALTIALCVMLFLLGRWIKQLFHIEHNYFPYLMTGFEYGMLGISLFGAAYGIENISYIAVVDLGHEIFIWFIFLPLLLVQRDGSQKPKEIVQTFLTAPVAIAILAGIFFNFIGVRDLIYGLPVTGALMSTFNFLSNITVPLILIIVGYGIKINRNMLGAPLAVTLIRLIILIPLALVLNRYLVHDILQLDRMFEIALFTLLILPPPFIIPLYTSPKLSADENEYINNTLTIHTIVSVLVFSIFFILSS